MSYIYQGNFSDALTKSTADIDNIELFTLSQNRRKSVSKNHTFTVLKKIKNDVFTANFKFSYNDVPAEYGFVTDSLLLPLPLTSANGLFYVLQDKNTKEQSANIDLSYLHKLNSAYFLRVALGANYARNDFISDIYENIPNADKEVLAGLSNDFYLGAFNQNLNVRLTKNEGVFGFKIGLTASNKNFNHNINRVLDGKNKIVLEPELEISITPKQSRRFSVLYQKTTTLTPITDLISEMYINSFDSYANGSNFEKLFAEKHSFSTIISDFNQFHNTQFFITARYEQTNGTTAKDYYRTGSLNETQVVASPNKYSILGTSLFSKKFLFAPISTDIRVTYRQNSYSYFTSGNEIKNKTYSTSVELGASSSYKEGLNFGLNANFSRNYYKTIVSNKQDIQRYSGKISFGKNDFYVSTSLAYEHNDARGIMQHFFYWNADIRYSFGNKKYELQLIGNDMLHTSNKHWGEITYTDNAMIERFVRRIPGNIMLKFNFKI
jgi:hypothetical protein